MFAQFSCLVRLLEVVFHMNFSINYYGSPFLNPYKDNNFTS